jgi:hypothetical protein
MTDSWFEYETDDLDYWRLCDELSVYEAALLIVGRSPSKVGNVEKLPHNKQPRGYEAAKTAIRNALRSGKIKGTIKPEFDDRVEGDPVPIIDSINLYSSRIEVESLKTWLIGRGFQHGFFFPNPVEAPGYLNPANPRYAPKLAAAVSAWQAVTDPVGRHPKQALAKWLREHAAEFDLSDDEGKPNETGIEEAAKVANWQPGGGAPKTPGG